MTESIKVLLAHLQAKIQQLYVAHPQGNIYTAKKRLDIFHIHQWGQKHSLDKPWQPIWKKSESDELQLQGNTIT